LYENVRKFMVISRSFLLKMGNNLAKCCRENQNKYFLFKNYFFSKILPFLDIVERNSTARQAIDDSIIWNMHVACWINKATDTHLDCDTHIASSRQPYVALKCPTLTFVSYFISC